MLLASVCLASKTKTKSKSKNKSKNKIKHRHHSTAKNRLKNKQEVPEIVFEGWLRIASETLIDAARYPDIPDIDAEKPAFPV